MSEVQVGRRGIEAGFDTQRSAGQQPLSEFRFDEQLVAAVPDNLKLLVYRCHAAPPVGFLFHDVINWFCPRAYFC